MRSALGDSLQAGTPGSLRTVAAGTRAPRVQLEKVPVCHRLASGGLTGPKRDRQGVCQLRIQRQDRFVSYWIPNLYRGPKKVGNECEGIINLSVILQNARDLSIRI